MQKTKYFSWFYHTILFPSTKTCYTKLYTLFYVNSKQTRGPIQITFNHLEDIEFEDLVNIYKKCAATSYPFLVVDTTLAPPDNILPSRHNLLEKLKVNIKSDSEN